MPEMFEYSRMQLNIIIDRNTVDMVSNAQTITFAVELFSGRSFEGKVINNNSIHKYFVARQRFLRFSL